MDVKDPAKTTQDEVVYPRKDRGYMAKVKAWYMLVLHFIFCLIVAVTMLYKVDGYKALGGTASRKVNGTYILRTSDVITLISMGLVLVKLTVASWSALAVWRCAFFCLERGITISQFSTLLSFKIPPNVLPRDKFSVAVILVLLGVIPQAFIAPLLSGAVNWDSTFEEGNHTVVMSGNPTSNFGLWGYYQVNNNVGSRVGAIRRAAGLAGAAWAADLNGPRNGSNTTPRCRHIVNSDGLSTNTTLLNVTMPCLIINSIDWPVTPSSKIPQGVIDVVKNSTLLSLAGDNPLSYVNYPGNAVIFDPTNSTLQTPFSDILDSSGLDNILTQILDDPDMPAPSKFSGGMTAVVQISQGYLYGPKFEDPFGYASLNNSYEASGGGVLAGTLGGILGGALGGILGDIGNFLDSLYTNTTFTYLNVNFTAGVMTGDSTYVVGNAVEGNKIPVESDIQADPWVREALYLLPDVMSMVAIMNSTQLNTYHNIENYTANLISYSYQGAWDMLQRTFDNSTRSLTAISQEPRVQATVNHARVYGWLAVSLLFTLSSLPLAWLSSQCKRIPVIDGGTALLLLDPSEVLPGRGDLTNLASVTDSESRLKVKLEETSPESGRFKLVEDYDEVEVK